MSYDLNFSSQFEFTKNNHLNYAVVDVDLVGTILFVKIGQLKQLKIPRLFQSAQIVAQDIYQKYKSDLNLCLSGGIDSQAMALSFLSQKIYPRISIFRFPKSSFSENFFNYEDISMSTNFCKLNNLKYDYIDFDLDQFYQSNEWREMAEIYDCSSPQIVAHFKCLEKVVGVPVLSWNLPSIYGTDSKRIGVPNYKYMSYLRYFHINKRQGVPYFFLNSPEVFYSAMLETSWLELFKKLRITNQNMSYNDKFNLYRSAGFSVVKQSDKLTGFEDYKKHFQVKFGKNDPWSFEKLLREPLEQKIIDYTEIRFELDKYFLQQVNLDE